METLCCDLGIPKHQIKTTQTDNRFIVLASRLWLKTLIKHKKVIDFSIYDSEQWPDHVKQSDKFKSWIILNVSVSKIQTKLSKC